jgi:glycerol-3-phosphate acyltransferase PlsY
VIIKIIYIILSYLCGAIPFAYIFPKIFAGVDVRTVGSGNPGTTNVFRAAGKKIGILTFVFDVLKGFTPVYFAHKIDPSFTFIAIVAVCTILGHIYTVFLGFKGGKGVATSLGVFLALMPGPAAIAAGAFAVIFLISGIVSLASILAAVVLVACAVLMSAPFQHTILAGLMAIIIIYKHKANIKRLMDGTENKFNIFGKK